MMIAIWGRDGIGKSTLAAALSSMFAKKDITAVINTDLTQPTLPMRLPGMKLEPDTSLGKALSGIGTGDAAPFLHQHPKNKRLFYAGLTDGDEYLSFELGLEADEKAQDFMEQCVELTETSILDLSGQRTDPFLPGALTNADKVIVPITPDVQGICWYGAVKPLLQSMNVQGRVLPVSAITDRGQSLSVIEKAGGFTFAASLPYVREFRQNTTMNPMDGTSFAALQYAKQAKKLYERVKGDGGD